MGSTRDERPATPTLAERARTLAARASTAAVMAAGFTGRVMPAHYQVHHSDSALLLLARDPDLPTLVDLAPGCVTSAMVELTDIAPVALRAGCPER